MTVQEVEKLVFVFIIALLQLVASFFSHPNVFLWNMAFRSKANFTENFHFDQNVLVFHWKKWKLGNKTFFDNVISFLNQNIQVLAFEKQKILTINSLQKNLPKCLFSVFCWNSETGPEEDILVKRGCLHFFMESYKVIFPHLDKAIYLWWQNNIIRG